MDVVYPFLRMKETTKVLTQSLYDHIWSCFLLLRIKETTKLLTQVECMTVFYSGSMKTVKASKT